MLSNPQTRKDKRWLVLVKPNTVCFKPGTNIPVYTYVSLPIVSAVSLGATQLRFQSSAPVSLRTNLEYNMYTTVVTDDPESVQINSYTCTSNGGTSPTYTVIINLKNPLTRSYEVGSRLSGGCFSANLDGDVASGDQKILVTNVYGVNIGTQLCLDNSLSTREVVTVTGISGSELTLSDPIFFDHGNGAPAIEVDSVKYNLLSSDDVKYRINFSTIYGKLPTTSSTSYAKLNSSIEKPWVEKGESNSFQEAKDIAFQHSKDLGVSNVRIVRVVDTYDVLYPIS